MAERNWLGSLVPIRSDLMRGDHRALYLGGLLGVQFREIRDDAREPPVPPGLGELSASLDCLADFLGIDADRISAAAERSGEQRVRIPSKKEIGDWIRTLPSAEKDRIVARLIDGEEPHLSADVRQRTIREISSRVRSEKRPARTAGEIYARAKTLVEERKKAEGERRARKQATRQRAEVEARKKRLEALAGTENELWSTVDNLIATKQPKRYDQAVSLVQDLHDLAEMQDNGCDFKSRMGVLQRKKSGKSTLIERLRKAKLLG